MKYLIKGSVSGIQEFIFNTPSKGAAKTLKARSYYVQILGSLASTYISINLEKSKLFYEGGGAFYINFYADDGQQALELFTTLEDNFRTVFESFELQINLAFVEVDDNSFGTTWANLLRESNLKKLKPIGNDTNFFIPFFRDKTNHFTESLEMVASLDNLLKNLRIDSANMVGVFETLKKLILKEVSKELLKVNFDKSTFDNSLKNKVPVWTSTLLNEYFVFLQNKQKVDLESFTQSYVLDNVIEFDAFGDFAYSRTGTNKIAVLKLDVDNLGYLFGTLNELEVEKCSKVLTSFFNDYIFDDLFNKQSFSLLGKKHKYNTNVYPIFSGGDDCFVVGSWDAIICFASDFQHFFTKYVAEKIPNERNLTISGGIVIIDPTYPVSSFSSLVESSLVKSKEKGKNAITIFGLTFNWDEFNHILKISRVLAEEMDKKSISRAYLDKIRKSAQGFNALQNNYGVDFDRIYKLKYYLSRNETKLGLIVENLFEPYYETLKSKLLIDDSKLKYDVAIYPTIARITELLTKIK